MKKQNRKARAIVAALCIAGAMIVPVNHAAGADGLPPITWENYGFRSYGYYPQTAIITELDEAADTVTVTTSAGFKFEFYGVEDWLCGEAAALIFYDNGTPEVIDDVIVDAQATGFYCSAYADL